MDKNVYSLVLMDEIVEAVDKLAYEQRTSRSGMINRILAEYLSFPTPEARMREIFGCMERESADIENFQMSGRPGAPRITIRSALRYRYRPTVHYALELYRRCAPLLGELRVSLRTQNDALLSLADAFFRCFNRIESESVGRFFPGGEIPCEIAPGRCTRKLRCPPDAENGGSERIAGAILGYIREFDSDLKLYFSDSDNPREAERKVRGRYLDYLNGAPVL